MANQASVSKPFLELNNQVGYHSSAQWRLHNKGTLSIGYYNNKATPHEIQNGQYGWNTRFHHLSMAWRLSNNLSFASQYISGKTLMQNAQRQKIVNNDFNSGFLALSYKWRGLVETNKHKSTLRAEHFSVTDNDTTINDNNNENGKAMTLSHTYRLAKHWFLSGELIIIDSHRTARMYEGNDIDLIEKHIQIGVRYFF